MKLGVMTVCLGTETFEDTCKYLSGLGVQEVEIGTGGYPGNAHCDPVAFLNDPSKIEEMTWFDILIGSCSQVPEAMT